VESTSAHNGEDITVYTIQDVEAGEQLFNTYTDCLDTDCGDELRLEYGTMQVLGDYGFVEDYPQKWIWGNLPTLEYEDLQTLVVELDRVQAPDPYDPKKETEQYQVTWLTAVRPDLQTINFLSGHVNMLDDLEGFVQESTEALASGHERFTIRELYKSLLLALQYTIWAYFDEAIEDLAIGKDGNHEGSSVIHHYDSLEKRPALGNPRGSFLDVCHPVHEVIGPDYRSIFYLQSQHQAIEFKYGDEEDDTCLYLSGWGQTCSAFRQYHEALVHYPGSFLPEIKRVAYIGGGDNMILHEILKYPSIELVLGLELDQDVVRYSFMNMGTLPYFDDPRVQWWFGDATKSLLMLPQDYFGSFDLVLVDLQNFVSDALYVTEKLSLMDTMKLLLKPNGIISKNEDFPNRYLTDFAKYTVDMEYCDLPHICRQSITIGSNGINFLTAPQYKHDIPTIYMKESLEEQGKFNNWYGFRDNHAGKNSSTEAPIVAQEGSKDSAHFPIKNNFGVLVVIEAEELSRPVQTKEELVEALTKTLGINGIEVLTVDDWAANGSHFDLVLIFSQGYLILRKRSVADTYMAMDLGIWDDLDKINVLKTALIESIGGDEQKSSSYRLVTGGIDDMRRDPYLSHYVAVEETLMSPDAATTGAEDVTPKDLSSVWSEFVKLIPGKEASIVVLCGTKDSTCASLEALKASSINAVVLNVCDDIVSEDTNDQVQLFQCEAKMAKTLREALPNKINGIWLDTTASQTTAKVLWRLLAGQIGRAEFLDNNNYTILAQLTGDEWREIFIERFRTEVSPIDPAKEARLSFTDDTTFSFFSAGDDRFYSSLVEWMKDMETTTQLTPALDTVISGDVAYVPNFSPDFFNNQAYDNSRAYSQWKSQKPIGYQLVSQMELKAPVIPLKVGEQVLYQFHNHVWLGLWTEATVVRQNQDLTYYIESEHAGSEESVSRDSLRRLDFDVTATPIPTVDIGARVLYHRELHGTLLWLQGFVVSRSEDGRKYQVRQYEQDGLILEVDVADFMPQYEITNADVLPKLSMTKLETTFRSALSKVAGEGHSKGIQLQGHLVGSGCVITAFWNGCSTVLVWDGAKHIDINLFLDGEDDEAVTELFYGALMDKIPFLAIVVKDDQPRGYGGVINFRSETEPFREPFWQPGAVNRDEAIEAEEEDDDEEDYEEDDESDDEEDDESDDEEDDESDDEDDDEHEL
jgi:spermidine synthase